jgi:predicted metal-dependent hydrolase
MTPSVTIHHRTIPILVRRHPGARRIVLRYQPVKAALTLTLPRRASLRQGLSFVEEKRPWIEAQLARQPVAQPVAAGMQLCVLGQPCEVVHVGGRGVVRREEGRLLVPGDAAFLPRRVRDWLLAQARAEISRQCHARAAELGKRVASVTLRDTSSLWGSCTSAGRLSFSWRLVLAPPSVLDYIVCHEVAHLVHLNHSAAFWQVVASLCPHYRESRDWLKRHGHTLHQLHWQ